MRPSDRSSDCTDHGQSQQKADTKVVDLAHLTIIQVLPTNKTLKRVKLMMCKQINTQKRTHE